MLRKQSNHQPDRYYVIRADVEAELLYSEYNRYGLILYQKRGNTPSMGILPIEESNWHSLNRYLTTNWMTIDFNGTVTEEQSRPEIKAKITNPLKWYPGMPDQIVQHAHVAETPPKWWEGLPSFNDILKTAFRGKVIDSINHPSLWS